MYELLGGRQRDFVPLFATTGAPPERDIVADALQDVGWWRYRVPGRGDIDWRAILDTLQEGGFDGTLSIEHEDPVWGGTVERVQRGLEIASRTLRPLMVPEAPRG